MKSILNLLIITSLSSFANDRPPSSSAPNYNSTMDPANSSRTTTTTGATGYETPSSDTVSTGASSTVRKKTTRKTLEESCEKIDGKMVCDQETKTQKTIKNSDATKDEPVDIPESDLE
ncbi:MAG: hypothetical protein H7281_04005 [Bacteriovorax sp.]|nr:hypothetical protein [Bacteriovorax sp.]